MAMLVTRLPHCKMELETAAPEATSVGSSKPLRIVLSLTHVAPSRSAHGPMNVLRILGTVRTLAAVPMMPRGERTLAVYSSTACW